MKKSKSVLKSYFNTGDKPTESQFSDLIDSLVHQDEANRIYITGTSTNDKGDTIVELSNGKSITIQKPHAVKKVNQDNKIRVIDLGVITISNLDNDTKSIEKKIADRVNTIDPPIEIKEDEIVIYEYDLDEIIYA